MSINYWSYVIAWGRIMGFLVFGQVSDILAYLNLCSWVISISVKGRRNDTGLWTSRLQMHVPRAPDGSMDSRTRIIFHKWDTVGGGVNVFRGCHRLLLLNTTRVVWFRGSELGFTINIGWKFVFGGSKCVPGPSAFVQSINEISALDDDWHNFI